jgi:tetratricopeptide (TPR) repeat protein
MSPTTTARQVVLVCTALALLAIAAYCPLVTDRFEFLPNADDGEYVCYNPHVQAGLTRDSVGWALRAYHSSNWHPLTWISLQLDHELFGSSPRGYHLMNLALHIAAVLMLFIALWKMTGAIGRSAFVAGLFAVHPLHVQSVAWVAERKDVLCGLFMMLTLWAYALYARRPGIWKYLLVVALFALGLSAKGTLITLPCVLFLLDLWPLRRLWPEVTARSEAASGREEKPQEAIRSVPLSRLVLEKVPLLALAGFVSWLIYRSHLAVPHSLRTDCPFPMRLMNALLSYVAYLRKMVWPNDLASYYPHLRDAINPWHAVAAGGFLTLVSIIVLLQVRRQPYLAVGWFWYVGMMVPVSGLFVQQGSQAMADRYTYFPLIGVYLMVAWGGEELLRSLQASVLVAPSLAVSLLVLCVVATRREVFFWRDEIQLGERCLAQTTNNYVGHSYLGRVYECAWRLEEAREQYEAALRIEPKGRGVHSALGRVLENLGQTEAAIACYREGLQVYPNAPTRGNLAYSLASMGRTAEARELYRAAVQLAPSWPAGIHKQAQLYLLEPATSWNRNMALRLAKQACDATESPNAEFLLTLAKTYAETGQFQAARLAAEDGIAVAAAAGQAALAREFTELIEKCRE